MLTSWIEPIVHHYGLVGLGGGIFFESMGAPLPGETLLVAAAGLSADGTFDVRVVAVVAFIAAVLGDNVGYFLGRRFGRPVVLANGARIGITSERLDRVEAVLEHRGVIVVVLARFFPLLRQLNGLAAGTVRMHWAEFVVANAIGAGLWVGAWSWAGFTLGANAHLLPVAWHLLQRFAWVVVPPLILGTVVAALWLRRRNGRKPAARAPRELDGSRRLR